MPRVAPAIDKAQFMLGVFHVHPGRNAIEAYGRSTAVEALVMDVLCALAQRPGEVLSRDAPPMPTKV